MRAFLIDRLVRLTAHFGCLYEATAFESSIPEQLALFGDASCLQLA
jgi:hypothetical protein